MIVVGRFLNLNIDVGVFPIDKVSPSPNQISEVRESHHFNALAVFAQAKLFSHSLRWAHFFHSLICRHNANVKANATALAQVLLILPEANKQMHTLDQFLSNQFLPLRTK